MKFLTICKPFVRTSFFVSFVFSLAIEAKEEKKQNELKTLVSAFQDFYKQVYKVHDFSFASIASENTKDTKKEVLTKGLQIVKNFK